MSVLFAGATLEPSEGATFLVTSAADPGDGVCDSTCTLREALAAANASSGNDTITFDLPESANRTIKLASPSDGGGALPAVTDTVVLDGSTPTGLDVFVRGWEAGPSANGLTIVADDSVVTHLWLRDFRGVGVLVSGADRVEVVNSSVIRSGSDGVRIVNGSDNVVRSDLVANGRHGVNVVSGTGNTIAGDIVSNDGLGIDLGGDGVTENDEGDADGGANGLQNAPVVSVEPVGSGPDDGYRALAELDSTPNTPFTIHVGVDTSHYDSGVCDASGHGEDGTARSLSTSVVTDASGHAAVAFPPVGASDLAFGDAVTATATNEVTGDTSEFSNCERAGFTHASVSMSSSPEEITIGDSARFRIDFVNQGPHTALDAQLWIVIPEASEILEMVSSAGDGCVRLHIRTIVCELGDVQAGSTERVEIIARPQKPGRANGSVVISSPNVDWGTPGYLSLTHVRVRCTETGGAGDNVIVGTSGDDVLCGGGGDDTLVGRGGKDILLGGRGDDVLRGGSGFDQASFADSSHGVTASLTDLSATGRGHDRLANIEGLVGSHFVDRLTGDAGRNVFRGLQGRDALSGRRGNDHSSILDLVRDSYSGGRGRDSARRDEGRDVLRSVERAS